MDISIWVPGPSVNEVPFLVDKSFLPTTPLRNNWGLSIARDSWMTSIWLCFYVILFFQWLVLTGTYQCPLQKLINFPVGPVETIRLHSWREGKLRDFWGKGSQYDERVAVLPTKTGTSWRKRHPPLPPRRPFETQCLGCKRSFEATRFNRGLKGPRKAKSKDMLLGVPLA